MDKLQYYVLKYPNHLKYGLLLVDIFAVIFAIKIFVNYNNIEQAIEETSRQSAEKTEQLGYTKNFQIPYEQSEYSKMFMKHENNMLLGGEFIIKLEEKKNVGSGTDIQTENKQAIKFLDNPPDARNQFLKEKIFGTNTNK